MAELKIKGTVKVIDKVQNGVSKAGNSWQKSGLLIETFGTYPKTCYFSGFGEIVDVIQGLNLGDEVEISFDPESREYNGRYYTDNKAWKIESVSASALAPEPVYQSADDPIAKYENPQADDDGELPF